MAKRRTKFVRFCALSVVAASLAQFWCAHHAKDATNNRLGNHDNVSVFVEKAASSNRSRSNDDEERKKRKMDKLRSKLRSSKTKREKVVSIHRVGPCVSHYPVREPPKEGFLKGVDWYFFRKSFKTHQDHFLRCVDGFSESIIDNDMLIQATSLGFDLVVEKLMTKRRLDPLYSPPRSRRSGNDDRVLLNAVQEAVRGGHARIVKVLTNSNNSMVVDVHGRTVADYVAMVGSPIRPHDAKHVLGLDSRPHGSSRNDGPSRRTLWSNSTSYAYSESCDIEVAHHDVSFDEFVREYYSTGRPVLLRGHVPRKELDAFSEKTLIVDYPPSKRLVVGPTAYPRLTGQRTCRRKMTLRELENATKCAEMPDSNMMYAHHPNATELRAFYSKNDQSVGWRTLEEWFGRRENVDDDDKLTWQVFLGGDGSGATFHWHQTALNNLYVGTKEWRLTPPYYRGWTGMPSRRTERLLDEKYTLSCTQRAGDLVYVPAYWGHMTLNHGFTAGAAVIVDDATKK